MEKRILVLAIRAIGDVALITPVPRLLRKKFPRAYIGILADGQSVQVLQENPHLDRIYHIDRTASKHLSFWRRLKEWICLVVQLRNEKFDAVVDLFSGPRSAWLAWFSGAPDRYGEDFRVSIRGYLYNHLAKIDRDHMHLVQQKLKIIEPFIGEISPEAPELEIHVTGEERQAAVERLGEGGMKIGLIPGAGSHWRRWPPERFAELGEHLIREYHARLFLLGTGVERPVCGRISDLMTVKPVNLAGHTTLRELMAILAEMNLVISNVTGPLHLASAMKKPRVIGLYGAADIIQYAPWGNNAHLLTKGSPTDAYWKKVDYPADHEYLLKITVEDVVDVAREILCANKRSATISGLTQDL